MTPKVTFGDLPREIREMIYEYAFEPSEPVFTNAMASQTAYTAEKFPLFYLDKKIFEDMQPKLYREHTMVIPIQEPCDYVKRELPFAPRVAACSKRMRQSTRELIVETSQTTISHYGKEFFEEYGSLEKLYAFWYKHDRGKRFAKNVVNQILSLKRELPNIKRVKFVFWFGCWIVDNFHWEAPLRKLQRNWPGLFIEVEFNLFDFIDHEVSDDNYEDHWLWIWDNWQEDKENTLFSARNFKWAQHVKGNFLGKFIDTDAWTYEDFIYNAPDQKIRAQESGECEGRPLAVNTAPLNNMAYLYHALPIVVKNCKE
ncbi:hypothetical protein NM208_g4007 [Fusarium decemcellulare]|uniref:Uncharacterized protein n=1 Tax=Fusarium decemcellulare TaxID=57161 RepID=A0ACC1SM33_9HYPO|nr:hypothetical protein NM208_g4007 [Fusarium decemcellulare]